MKLKHTTHVEGHGPYAVIISQPVYQDGSYTLSGVATEEIHYDSVLDAILAEQEYSRERPASATISLEGPGLE
jgi:hypothetical protein